jgi:hypothetical protein
MCVADAGAQPGCRQARRRWRKAYSASIWCEVMPPEEQRHFQPHFQEITRQDHWKLALVSSGVVSLPK